MAVENTGWLVIRCGFQNVIFLASGLGDGVILLCGARAQEGRQRNARTVTFARHVLCRQTFAA
jgi:hypothetical protein